MASAPRPRRPWRLALLLSVVVGLVLVPRFGWWWLPRYVPAEGGALTAPFRTLAEHDEVMRDRDWPYLVRIESPAGGVLVYFGSRHTADPDDPQVAEIRAGWDDLRPTVAATENRLGPFLGTTDMGIAHFGEFGLVAALARRDDVPIYSLEPTWETEVAEVTAAFPVEEVTLFYTLRVFLSERGDREPEEADALAAHLLAKRGGRPGLAGSLPDLAALDALWDERFADLGPWRALPYDAVDPAADGNRLQAIATLANEVRDRHAARVLLELVGRGERVFAVAGGSHVVKQEPVLRAGLEGP